ncbi:MAG: hypothetical protein IH623_31075 [Verrucomicrobia bacterium]|nr:hypothetical protein [Verrucomicrobiota bacterium]
MKTLMTKLQLLLFLAMGVAVPFLYAADDCVSETSCTYIITDMAFCLGFAPQAGSTSGEDAYWLASSYLNCGKVWFNNTPTNVDCGTGIATTCT